MGCNLCVHGADALEAIHCTCNTALNMAYVFHEQYLMPFNVVAVFWCRSPCTWGVVVARRAIVAVVLLTT